MNFKSQDLFENPKILENIKRIKKIRTLLYNNRYYICIYNLQKLEVYTKPKEDIKNENQFKTGKKKSI